jgi:hypothetical protein
MKTLELNQMEKVTGGIDPEEYCLELEMIVINGGAVPGVSEWAWNWNNCSYWTGNDYPG